MQHYCCERVDQYVLLSTKTMHILLPFQIELDVNATTGWISVCVLPLIIISAALGAKTSARTILPPGGSKRGLGGLSPLKKEKYIQTKAAVIYKCQTAAGPAGGSIHLSWSKRPVGSAH